MKIIENIIKLKTSNKAWMDSSPNFKDGADSQKVPR